MRYALTFALVIIGMTGVSQANFVVTSGTFLVNTHHDTGAVTALGSAQIVTGGSVNALQIGVVGHVDMSDGTVQSLTLTGSGSINATGGSINSVNASGVTVTSFDNMSIESVTMSASSSLVFSDGSLQSLNASGASKVYLTNTLIQSLTAIAGAEIDFHSGSMQLLTNSNGAITDLRGGFVGSVKSSSGSITRFNVSTFSLGSGLSLSGNQILGTGTLSGTWIDGAAFATVISENSFGAQVLVPEPSFLAFFSAFLLVRRRRFRIDQQNLTKGRKS